MRLASGFMAAKHLFAASELGLFEALADAPADARCAGRSHRAHPPGRAHQRRRHGGARPARARRRHATATRPTADRFLAGPSAPDLRPLLRFWDRSATRPGRRWPARSASGPPAGDLRRSTTSCRRSPQPGSRRSSPGPRAALAQVVRLRRAQRRLLDIGGGTGSWSIAARAGAIRTSRPPSSSCPSSRPSRQGQRRRGWARRPRSRSWPATSWPATCPPGHDVFLVANLVHYWSAEQNRALLRADPRRGRPRRPPAARRLLDRSDPHPADPRRADGRRVRRAPARTATSTASRRSAAGSDETGWRFVEHRALAGPQSLIVAAADRP